MALSAGSSLGPYEVVSPLGAGGMGEVYKARDTRLGRTVAIKILPPGAVTATQRARLLQEARTVSNLNHPNIVTLFDVGEQSGTDYLVLEFVPGQTLDRVIGPSGMPLPAALKAAIAIASAVSSAHGAGVLHRDLKPANVMINDSGSVKVLDFGLAKTNLSEPAPRADDATVTMPDLAASRPGTIAGTPAYMSPEQAEGRTLDSRSDVFSFGAVLYEMITGQRAFTGDSAASILAAVLREQPRPVRQVIPGAPRELERLVERCLRKDPARRMSSLHDIKVELEDILADVESGVSNAPEPAARAARPSRRWIAYAAAGAALLGAAWTVIPRPPRGPMEPPVVTPFTSFPGNESQPAFSADGNQIAFTWNGPAQDNNDIYVKVVGSAEPLRLTNDPAPDFSPAWSPDGKWIYFVRAAGRELSLHRVSPLGGKDIRMGGTRCVNDLAFDSGSGRLICQGWDAGGQPVIYSAGSDGGDEKPIVKGCTPAATPDGKLLLYSLPCNNYADVFAISLDGAQAKGEPRRVTKTKMFVASIRMSPDGRAALIAMGGGMADARLHMVRLHEDDARPMPFAERGLGPLAVAPTGRFAFSHEPRVRHIWAIENGKESKHASSSTLIEYSPAFSPDGKRIVFESTRSGTQQIWITDADGSHPAELTSGGRTSGTPRWSPDGRWIAFDRRTEEGETAIFVVDASGGRPRQITRGQHRAVLPNFSGDGKWIYFKAFFGNDGTICRVPFEGGPHDVATAQRLSPEGADAAWESADGKNLYYVRSVGGNAPLFRVPVAGGNPVEMPIRVAQRALTVRPEGIYYMRLDFSTKPETSVLLLHDPATKQERELARVPGPPGGGLTVSPDRKTILYSKSESPGADIMVVDKFRY